MKKEVAALLVEVLADAGACPSPALNTAGSLLPPLTEIRRVAADIAFAVGIEPQENGVAPLMSGRTAPASASGAVVVHLLGGV